MQCTSLGGPCERFLPPTGLEEYLYESQKGIMYYFKSISPTLQPDISIKKEFVIPKGTEMTRDGLIKCFDTYLKYNTSEFLGCTILDKYLDTIPQDSLTPLTQKPSSRSQVQSIFNGLIHSYASRLFSIPPSSQHPLSTTDWFTAILYLLSKCKSTTPHPSLILIPNIKYLWPLKSTVDVNDVHLQKFNHTIQHLVNIELSILNSAFIRAGCTPSMITTTWLNISKFLANS
jgi:hypothetical protein